MELIRAEGIEAAFSGRGPRRSILQAIDLQVREGETFGLIGSSGCGKSTLLRLLAGLHQDWQGQLDICGQHVVPGRYPRNVLRRDLQMVFQDSYASLHPRHRVGDALSEVIKVNRLPAGHGSVEQVLAEVGLPAALVRALPHQMSGGQRQRVAIAKALLLRPRLLLLDEPTSALDVSVQAGVLNLLNALKNQHGMTLVLVSHDPGVIAHMCDRAVRMEAGRIIERLEAADLRLPA